jgi:hypothetical protein
MVGAAGRGSGRLRGWRRCLVGWLIGFTAGCGRGGGGESTVRDSAGVVIVENPGTDHPLRWRLTPVATIRSAAGGPDLTDLTELTVDADTLGHVFALEAWFGHRVQLIDTLGHLERVLTRDGAGPGEVGEAVSISAGPDGVVGVMDFTKSAIVRVDAEGRVLPRLSLAGYGLFGGARVLADTVVLHTMAGTADRPVEELQYRTSTDTATLVVHAVPRLGPIPFCGEPMAGLTPMLTPELRWTARGSLVAVSHEAAYRIDVFRSGRLVRIIRRAVTPLDGSVDAVRRFFPDGKVIGNRTCVVGPSELVAKRGVAPRIQPVRRVALDWDGRLWAERNTFPDDSARTDVFDPDGRYLGTRTGLGAPLGFPARGLLLTADSVGGDPRMVVLRRSP